MSNNTLITQLSSFANCSNEETSACVESVVEWMTDTIIEEGELTISGFGKFMIEKHSEYIQLNASYSKRTLIPPSLNLSFIPDPLLEESDKKNAVSFSNIANVLTNKHKLQTFQAEKIAVGLFKFVLMQMDDGKSVFLDRLGEFVLTKVEVDGKVFGKVTFVADKLLAEKVNRPFSYFYPVDLNDGVVFDDIETIDSDVTQNSHLSNNTFLISDDSKISVAEKENENSVTEDKMGKESPAANDDFPIVETEREKLEASNAEMEGKDENVEHTDGAIPLIHTSSEEPGGNRFKLRNVSIIAAVLVACLALLIVFVNKNNDSNSSDNSGTADIHNVTDNAANNSSQKAKTSSTVEDKNEAVEADAYHEMNSKIPYGAYDIVGVQAEIAAPPGMDMAAIARVYMGADNPTYLVIMNGGITNPEPGTTIIIPKLKERKRNTK